MNQNLCECGCGQITKIYRNKPRRFVSNHYLKSLHKGGIAIRKNRKDIFMPTHPFANCNNYVRNARLVAEKALGKYLPKDAIVHHINHNSLDDRPENLIICENDLYHQILHARETGLKNGGNVKSRKCYFCHQYDSPDNLYISPKGNAYHRNCKNKYQSAKRSK